MITIKKKGSSLSVKIYDFDSHGRHYWQVYWKEAGKKCQKGRNSEEAAREFANEVLDRLEKGPSQSISAAQHQEILQITELIAPSGKSMFRIAREFMEIWKSSGGKSPTEIFEFWQAHHVGITDKTAAKILPELLTMKRQDGVSEDYLKDLDTRLQRFATHFKTIPLSRISGPDIDAWLRGMNATKRGKDLDQKLSKRSRNNYRDAVRALWVFAKDKNYLSDQNKELKKIKSAKVLPGKIQIWTPAEMRKMLNAAKPELLPYLALRAFAGIRYKEGRRLRPQHIKGEFIRVNAESAKTSEQRLVPIQPNLQAWLDRCKLKDPICQAKNPGSDVPALARKCGFEPRHNALRDSFISYRVAITQNIDQVALESGNSPRMIFRSYREIVTPEEAREWFDIFPPAPIELVNFDLEQPKVVG